MATKAKAEKNRPKAPANGTAGSIPVEVLTLEQAAKFLQLPVETIRAEAQAGLIPGREIGREWRFSRERILEWLGSTGRATKRFIYMGGNRSTVDDTPEEQEAFLARLREIRAEYNAMNRQPEESKP